MASVSKRLESLQPYLLGVRYAQGLPVADTMFREGWVMPKSEHINKEGMEGQPNYYMFYSDNEEIGFDELIDFVEDVVKLNIEREQKHELLKKKFKELQILFKETPLVKLETMKFVLGGDSLVPDLLDVDMTEEVSIPDPPEPPPKRSIKEGEQPPKAPKSIKTGNEEIELPPKGEKIEVEVHELPPEMVEGDCACGPEEACPKCMDKKGY